MTRLGLSLPPDLLALAAASHSGEAFHLAGAQRILDGCGCTEDDLGNPADRPFDPVEAAAWIAAGRPRTPARAQLLRQARRDAGHRPAPRLGDHRVPRPGHPLQRAIAATVEDLTGEQVAHTAVDGCGSPLFAVSLHGPDPRRRADRRGGSGHRRGAGGRGDEGPPRDGRRDPARRHRPDAGGARPDRQGRVRGRPGRRPARRHRDRREDRRRLGPGPSPGHRRRARAGRRRPRPARPVPRGRDRPWPRRRRRAARHPVHHDR